MQLLVNWLLDLNIWHPETCFLHLSFTLRSPVNILDHFTPSTHLSIHLLFDSCIHKSFIHSWQCFGYMSNRKRNRSTIHFDGDHIAWNLYRVINSYSFSFTHSLILSFTHWIVHSFTHSLFLSVILIHSFSHWLVHSFTHSLIYLFTLSLILSFTRSLIPVPCVPL